MRELRNLLFKTWFVGCFGVLLYFGLAWLWNLP